MALIFSTEFSPLTMKEVMLKNKYFCIRYVFLYRTYLIVPKCFLLQNVKNIFNGSVYKIFFQSDMVKNVNHFCQKLMFITAVSNNKANSIQLRLLKRNLMIKHKRHFFVFTRGLRKKLENVLSFYFL